LILNLNKVAGKKVSGTEFALCRFSLRGATGSVAGKKEVAGTKKVSATF